MRFTGYNEWGETNDMTHFVFHRWGKWKQGAALQSFPAPSRHHENKMRHIVMVYPQTTKDELKNNPQGCWDWGYDGKSYAWKSGSQLSTVRNVVEWVFTGASLF